MEKQNFAYPIGISDESFAHLAFGVQGIPHLVLIEQNGIIRMYEVGLTKGIKLNRKL